MKKITALFIALFILSLSAPVFAGPFSDVKPGHWAYEAIKDLSSKGILEGYPDGTFKGTKALTRYEAAQMVARLIEKGGVGDYETLQKLTIEFADELALLGVKVTALEDEMKAIRSQLESGAGDMGKIKVTAENRIRFEENAYSGLNAGVASTSFNNNYNRFRLNMAAKIDENVSGYLSFQDSFQMGTAKQFNNNVAGAMNRDVFLAYFDVKNFGGYLDNVRLGRFTYTLGKGFLLDDEVDGLLVKKEYHGTMWHLGAFEADTDIIGNMATGVAGGGANINDGFNMKLLSVDHAWKRIAAGLYYVALDRGELANNFGNLTVGGLTVDAKLGKDVVAYIEFCQQDDAEWSDAIQGRSYEGDGMKVGAEWTINKYYDLSLLYQDRGRDFRTMSHNDDYSDSAFYGDYNTLCNQTGFVGYTKAGVLAAMPNLAPCAAALSDNYFNSNIMSVIFGAKLRDDLQLDIWYETLKGKDDTNAAVAGTQSLNYDQSVAQAVLTYQYRDNTAFKLRYRAVSFDDGDEDITAAAKAAGAYPTDNNQLRLDMSVKF